MLFRSVKKVDELVDLLRRNIQKGLALDSLVLDLQDRWLPRFMSQVRLMFTPFEIKTHIARVERELADKTLPVEGDDDLLRESPTTIAKRAGQFATIKELLTATELGTS